MLLNELINQVTQEELASFLFYSYQFEKSYYLDVLKTLKSMEPNYVDCPLELLIFEGYTFTGEVAFHVEGISRIKDMDKVPVSYKELEEYILRYSISFCPWEECLSYSINEESLKNLSKLSILVIIIEELSRFGLTEAEIINNGMLLHKLLEEGEKDIEEGKFHTLEELGYKDVRTEEEKDSDREKMNNQAIYNLKKYYEHIKKPLN